ncbi:MAG: hypothetical protein OHK0021_15100 [Bryobacter sp.]
MLIANEDSSIPPAGPTLCREVGKDCKSCVASNASTLAFLCPSLEPSAAQHFFFKIYPSPGCSPMARSFVREYLSAIEPVFESAFEPVVELCA